MGESVGGGVGSWEHDDEDEDELLLLQTLGAFPVPVKIVEDAAEETLLLWTFQQPTKAAQNAYVQQRSLHLRLDACGHSLDIMQTPSSMNTPGVTGGVMWDSGVVLAKLLEHSVDVHGLQLQGKKCVELGAGCGLVGCVAALLGADVILTDLTDRLRLLQKNVDENVHSLSTCGSASVRELTWGETLDDEVVEPLPDFVLASDVVYNEDVVPELLKTLQGLTGPHTTVLLAGELRNDAVLECFFTCALVDFVVGRVRESDWHPDFQSSRVAVYVLSRRKTGVREQEDRIWGEEVLR
ncbi:unnamed protein product [Sphagnum troendelagicum]|uniref:Uncharacterized protein n=1 Tax=Sphagnum troendelagicum TaxID=128251 RepID=A0ABP0U923_9BRYO